MMRITRGDAVMSLGGNTMWDREIDWEGDWEGDAAVAADTYFGARTPGIPRQQRLRYVRDRIGKRLPTGMWSLTSRPS